MDEFDGPALINNSQSPSSGEEEFLVFVRINTRWWHCAFSLKPSSPSIVAHAGAAAPLALLATRQSIEL